MPYIGRFAPSPTGPLHAGSLVAALASYLDALVHGGQWLLRIDDADLSRVHAGTEQIITDQLRYYGFAWHGPVTHTQDFRSNHVRALALLSQKSLTYACSCTRANLAHTTPNADGERVYPQHCRQTAIPSEQVRSMRLACPDGSIQFTDRWAGAQQQNVAQAVGDFVLWRPEWVTGFASGLHHYQLTMVVDDDAQGVTHVVPGADLLGNTARQCLLYDLLKQARPSYLHVPLVLMENGLKLSKQHGAKALPTLGTSNALPYLERALQHLGFKPTGAVNLAAFWSLAAQQWGIKLNSPQLSARVTNNGANP